ncbi:MAG: lamin tail domain-containing protein, partial [Thermoleophilia bacterium]|nr:lamin tail domain-containing protein [Thermoleophilia bacterium]
MGLRPFAAVLVLLFGLTTTNAAVPGPTTALSSTVVISQVYGGGGNAGAPFRNDFVELLNRGVTSVSLTGWSVQYASATGAGTFAANPVTSLSGDLAPGQYALVQMASGGAIGAALPAPDATGTTNMSATAGKVILVSSNVGLACNGGSAACDAGQLAMIVDLVGWGSADFHEGALPAPATSNTTGVLRSTAGCTETYSNRSDFTAGAPTPRNTATALHPCGPPPSAPVVTTEPADAAVAVGTTATFHSAAVGVPDPTVRWEQSTDGGGTWADIAGATGTSLGFVATAEQDGFLFRAVFTNASGSTASRGARLSVVTPPV